METTAPKAILIESNGVLRDISRLVALTRMTETGLGNLQERTGSIKNFSHSAVVPDDQTRTGVNSFKLEHPDTEAIFEALRAAGRHVLALATKRK
jgi:hypothetical protein